MNPGRPYPSIRTVTQSNPNIEAPSGGPVFEIDPISLLAKIDPDSPPSSIQGALREQGFRLVMLPDRPIGAWLKALQRDAVDPWECPMVAVQVVTLEGARTKISPAPRSAAGPDLRWSTMRRCTTEWVQVPIRPDVPEHIISEGNPNIDRQDIRPVWHAGDTWGFSVTQKALADICFGKEVNRTEPARSHKKDP